MDINFKTIEKNKIWHNSTSSSNNIKNRYHNKECPYILPFLKIAEQFKVIFSKLKYSDLIYESEDLRQGELIVLNNFLKTSSNKLKTDKFLQIETLIEHQFFQADDFKDLFDDFIYKFQNEEELFSEDSESSKFLQNSQKFESENNIENENFETSTGEKLQTRTNKYKLNKDHICSKMFKNYFEGFFNKMETINKNLSEKGITNFANIDI